MAKLQDKPLQIGGLTVKTPVVLAPMAGVTNAPFRRLCREFATLGLLPIVTQSATQLDIGLYVAEMVTSRAVVERNPRAMRIINFDDDEYPRSAQVYGVDPATVGAAVAIIAGEDRADHIDLNFGCPVPKVTRKGGGGALPWKTDLFADILRAAVAAAKPFRVPVTVKMRIGIDDDHITYLDAGRIAVTAGISAITLHARTVAQRYSGAASWDAITRLKNEITDIPVLGNGDIFSAADAAEMRQQTNCDGIVVGRGALGRPWLFADLISAQYAGEAGGTPGNYLTYRPTLKQVAEVILRHGELLTAYYGDEALACRDLRKHIAWYLRGFPVGGEIRRELALITSLTELATKLATLPDFPYPDAADGPRGRAGSAKKPHLPYGWLDSRELNPDQACALTEDESDTDGG